MFPQFSAFLETETDYSVLLTLPLLSAVISVDMSAISRYAIFFHSFFAANWENVMNLNEIT